MTSPLRALVIALLAVNIFDVVIHVAIDQVEPLRVTSNVVVIVTSILMLALPRARSPWLAGVVGLVYLALNLTFIALDGIGPLGVILIVVTVGLLATIGLLTARRSDDRAAS